MEFVMSKKIIAPLAVAIAAITSAADAADVREGIDALLLNCFYAAVSDFSILFKLSSSISPTGKSNVTVAP